MRMLLALSALTLGACASPATQSGFLSGYENLQPETRGVRAKVSARAGGDELAGLKRVSIAPTRFADGADPAWMTPAERQLLLREVDAQLCFELSERYAIAADDGADARVRAAVTNVQPTGRAASAAAAAAGFFIPGPIKLRAPGTLGALGAEAELMHPDGRQLAAISWNRAATPVGTDGPSLSRIGDALQFAEPFADAAAKAITAPQAKHRKIDKPDPCVAYGARFRPEGFLAKAATGLYVPGMSGARAAEPQPAGAATP